jgi:hypothetical protein
MKWVVVVTMLLSGRDPVSYALPDYGPFNSRGDCVTALVLKSSDKSNGGLLGQMGPFPVQGKLDYPDGSGSVKRIIGGFELDPNPNHPNWRRDPMKGMRIVCTQIGDE